MMDIPRILLVLFLSVVICVCLLLTWSGPVGLGLADFESTVTVRIKQGLVQGKVMQALNGRDFYAFLGIPFGKVNVRFQAADPAGQWAGVLNATDDAPACVQPDSWTGKRVIGVEDCLTLNIYTPKLPKSGQLLLPVMVFIYGGAFVQGHASWKMYGPEKFLNNDIVLVVIQYRVGPFGFLSTHDEASQGNYGLLDQNLALKWTKDNIQDFGGNHNKVTLFGESAGGASVIYQVLSPLSNGLFHNAIAQSGSAICPWAHRKNPLTSASRLAKELNCSTDNTFALVECLRNVSANDIISGTISGRIYIEFDLTLTPVIENVNGGKFLTESPWKLLKSGNFNKVPLIVGVTQDEGSFLVEEFMSLIDADSNETDLREKVRLPNLLERITGIKNDTNFTRDVEQEYFKDVNYGNKTDVLTRLSELVSDASFKGCSYATALYVAGHGVPVYVYIFDYVTEQHFLTNITGKLDVSHGQDLFYQFTQRKPFSRNTMNFTKKEMFFSSNFIDLWTNFANTSVPTSADNQQKWTCTPKNEIKYFRVSTHSKMETLYDTRNFWNVKYAEIAQKIK